MDIKIATEEDKELWDSLVEKSTHSTIFHSWDFLKIIEKHTGTRLYPLIGLNGTTPIGIYPLFYERKLFLRMVYSPPPHVAVLHLGPAFVYDSTVKQSRKESLFIDFQEKVDEFISSELHAHYVMIRTSPGLTDARPLKWAGYDVSLRYSYSVDLSNGMEAVWKNLDKKFKHSIEKAKEAGVSVEEGSVEELEKIYELLTERYEEQDKVVTVPKEYLLEVYNLFKSSMKVFVARYEGEIKTGVIDFCYKGKTLTWMGNPKTNLNKIYPNDLLFWKVLEKEYDNGSKRYEVMGAAGIERLHGYYANYNPSLLVNYSAVRYNSIIAKAAEKAYTNIIKPVRVKTSLMLGRRRE